MPRPKATKKRPAFEPTPVNENRDVDLAFEASNGLEGGTQLSANKSKARAKKATPVEEEINVNELKIPVKKPASRVGGKKKQFEDAENELNKEMPAAKSKVRGKKTVTDTLKAEVADPQPNKLLKSRTKKEKTAAPELEPVVDVGDIKVNELKTAAKKPAASARGKKKQLEDAENEVSKEMSAPESKVRGKRTVVDVGVGDQQPIQPLKSRARKEKTSDLELQEAVVVETKISKGRGRKKVDDAVISQSGPAQKSIKEGTTAELKKNTTRTKKSEETVSDEPIMTKKPRGRGSKRLADSEISEVLEAESESMSGPTAKKRTKKTAEQNHVDTTEPVVTSIRERTKKSNEEQTDLKVEPPITSKKRGKTATTTKVKDNAELMASVESKPVAARGRKRAAAGSEPQKDIEADDENGSKTSKVKKSKSDASVDITTFVPPPDKEFNLKISSWNVAGLRAWLKKDGLRFVDLEQPDILCLQETKCANEQLPDEVARLPGYHPYWLCMPGGYAGVAIYSKVMPINVEYGIGNEEFDDVGRIITAEYEKFFLINVYVPNSGRKLVNLEPRMRWEQLFQEYVKRLDALKPVVICGDMNVSHQEIDLANPKTNTRNAGFTIEERTKMTELLALGFVDTFRQLYPKRTGAYTFWTYMANARARNVGWRLDYCIVSERFVSRIVDNCIRHFVLGSDHCPITVFLNI